MEKPDDTSEETWVAFKDWCYGNDAIDFDSEDIEVWWDCWLNGYEFGCVTTYDTIRGAIG